MTFIARSLEEWISETPVPKEAAPWVHAAWHAGVLAGQERSAQAAEGLARYYRMAAQHHLPVEFFLIIARDRASVCDKLAEIIRKERD